MTCELAGEVWRKSRGPQGRYHQALPHKAQPRAPRGRRDQLSAAGTLRADLPHLAPFEILSLNQSTGAPISIVVRSTTRSNQRPDTLMQDHKPTDR